MTTKVDRKLECSATARGRERRIYERFELGAANGTLVCEGNRSQCQVLDISLGGCRVCTVSPFLAGALAPVEIILQIDGMILRISGITQWTSNGREIGVRFIHPSLQSKNQLVSLLTCLVDNSVTEVVKAAIAAEAAARPGAPTIALERPAPELQEPQSPNVQPENRSAEGQAASPAPAARPDEPRIRNSEKDPWPAVIRFLKDNHSLTGVIVDLSLSNCRIRIPKPYPFVIRQRVEVDFRMRGLPFRLAGSVDDIRNTHLVNIRFAQLSNRKQDELAQLISELGEEEQMN